MDFLEKLELLMKTNSLNKNSLSKLSEIPYTTIDGWFKKGYESMQLTTLKKLSNFFETSLDFWANDNIDDPSYGKTNNFKVEFSEMQVVRKYRLLDTYGKEAVDGILDIEYRRCSTFDINKPIDTKGSLSFMKAIPLADASLSAGNGIGPLTDTAESIEIDSRQYPKADIAFKVKGDSMEPMYYDGDIVYVKQQQTLDAGQIGAFLYNDEQYLKKYVVENGRCILRSLNSNYKDIIINENDSFIIYGKVLS